MSKLKIVIPADVSWNHEENGFILATVIDSKFLNVPEPKEYNKLTIQSIYEKIIQNQNELTNKNNNVKPNVIFLMSESFWDPSFVNGLKINKDPIPNYHRIAEETASGKITVPGIGGGTANTEFEVLTGFTRQFIRDYATPYNPYNSYINRPIHSLASVFSQAGYSTTAIHTYHSWFYKRNVVYQYLGFDKFLSLETLPQTPKIEGLFTEDSQITELFFQEMNRTSNPDFFYAISMQGHGPYTDMPLLDNGISIKNNNIDSESEVILNKYLNNLYSIDEDLGNLVSKLKDFDEPTILVFFGDHIPPLGNEVYENLGFNTYKKEGKETPVLIWNNYDTKRSEIDFNANMLGAHILSEIGLTNNPYFNYLDAYSKVSPHIDPEENSEMFRNFELLQFDIVHGDQHFYDLIGKPDPNNDYTIGYQMKIKDVVLSHKTKDDLIIDILGEGFGWMSSVILNSEDISPLSTSGSRITLKIKRDLFVDNKENKISVKNIDSRGKTIKVSEEFILGDIYSFEKEISDNKIWKKVSLDEKMDWELFEDKESYSVVRANIELDEIGYFVESPNQILDDKSAEEMDRGNQSDIYANGYLYISIPKNDSGWGDSITTADVKRFFKKNKYNLFLQNNY